MPAAKKSLCSVCRESFPLPLLVDLGGRYLCRKCARLQLPHVPPGPPGPGAPSVAEKEPPAARPSDPPALARAVAKAAATARARAPESGPPSGPVTADPASPGPALSPDAAPLLGATPASLREAARSGRHSGRDRGDDPVRPPAGESARPAAAAPTVADAPMVAAAPTPAEPPAEDPPSPGPETLRFTDPGDVQTFGAQVFAAFSEGDRERLWSFFLTDGECAAVYGAEGAAAQASYIRSRFERDVKAKREAFLKEGPRQFVRLQLGDVEQLRPGVFRFRRAVLQFQDVSGDRRMALSPVYKIKNRYRLEVFE